MFTFKVTIQVELTRSLGTRKHDAESLRHVPQLGGIRVRALTQGPEVHREPWEPLLHFPWYLQPAPSLAMSHTLASQETRMSDASGLRS